jgi:hypothetical protein
VNDTSANRQEASIIAAGNWLQKLEQSSATLLRRINLIAGTTTALGGFACCPRKHVPCSGLTLMNLHTGARSNQALSLPLPVVTTDISQAALYARPDLFSLKCYWIADAGSIYDA